MMYSKKAKLDRRNSVVAAVKKELKAHNAYIAPEQLKAIANAIDTSIFYGIEIIRTVDEAAKKLLLRDYCTSHSWAGNDGTEDTVEKTVFGEISFGSKYSHEHFDNGNSAGPTERETNGEFDVNKPFCFLLNSHEWSNWEGSPSYSRSEDAIVIYTPESIIDEEQYVREKEAELEELCTLR